jgi:hypothetical protein
MNDEKLIGITAAARQIGISHSTLSRQVKLGQIRSHGGKVKLSEVLHDRDRNIDKSIWMFREKKPKAKSGARQAAVHGQQSDDQAAVHSADRVHERTTLSASFEARSAPRSYPKMTYVPLTDDLVQDLGRLLGSDRPSDPGDVGLDCIFIGTEMIEETMKQLRKKAALR